MQKLNAFWQSGVVACGCDPGLLSTTCNHNAFATSAGFGYIFYDREYFNFIDLQSSSTLPADFIMAHEFGHNVQLALNLNNPGKFKELQADCLGGYYVGYQARKGQNSQSEVVRTLQLACQIGDPRPSYFFEPGAHGTCQERVSAVQQGYTGYMSGKLPGQSCP